MNPVATVDLRESCRQYCQSIQKTLHELFNIEVNNPNDVQLSKKLNDQRDIYFSILFTGRVYGEFLIGINRKTALGMLGIPCTPENEAKVYLENRESILDTFKELINIAAGATLGELKKSFPEISITSPRAIEGYLDLSSFEISKASLVHRDGELTCFIYVDYLKLDVAEALDRGTAQLTIEQQKQEELKSLNRAKSEFLANMSHELRTPLNGMIGMLDVLKTSVLNPIQREQINVIGKSGELLLSIISDILEFSKIESGKLEIVKESFRLRNCVDTVVDSLAVDIHRKNLEFHVWIDPGIQGLYIGDEMRIKQVLINIIGNAIKFTPTGFIKVLVEMVDDDKIRFVVADSGVGIPQSKLNKIFDSFSQVDVSDTRRYGGSGLGLTICKSLVEAMGGTISVESVEAKGSEFTIVLPFARPAAILSSQKKEHLNFQAVKVFSENEFLFRVISSYVHHGAGMEICRQVRLGESVTVNQGEFVIVDCSYWKRMDEAAKKDFVEKIKSVPEVTIFVLCPQFLRQSVLDDPWIVQLKDQVVTVPAPISYDSLWNYLEKRNQATITSNNSVSTQSENVGDKNVLVVEDNEVNQVVLKTMLKTLGYNSILVNNGQRAVEMVSSNQFDAVLMDCQMPIMDGYSATVAIREQEKRSGAHVPIIAITANAFRETKEKCFECGMDEFITKPLKIESLKELMRKVLDK